MTHEKFWLEDPKYLFNALKVIPKDNMSLERQMNSLSRLVICVFLVLYLLGYKQSLLFLLLSLFFIIILYYLQKSKMATRENFLDSNISQASNIKRQIHSSSSPQKEMMPSQSSLDDNYIYKVEKLYNDFINQDRYTIQKFPSYYNQQIEKEVAVEPDQSYISKNQNLVGGANPKTKIRPVVAPPTHDWEYWRGNDFVFPNTINERSVQDYYSSGYYIDEDVDCGNKRKTKKSNLMVENKKGISEYDNYNISKPKNKRKDIIKENYDFNVMNKNSNNYFPISGQQDKDNEKNSCKSCSGGGYDLTPTNNFKKENGDFKNFDQNIPSDTRYTGDIDDACGYDQTNLYYDLPTNYSATNCQRRPQLKELNGQLFTSTITPGVYYKNQIIEPISSNIGISFTQQIPPRKVSYDNMGNKIYTGMDPRLFTPDMEDNIDEIDVPSNYDVYDPRSNGYGTSYRSYIDKLTGQPRFYYDDVDAIRRPNYLMRSDVDFLKTADSYGPIKEDEEEINLTENIRKNVDGAYLENTIDFRNDMMTRLMRKRNAELWQQRIAPITGLKK
jgi:hypothetical protein